MKRLIKFSLGSFVGWLLFNVSGSSRILAEQLGIFHLDDFIFKISTITLLVGWIATIVFSIPVLFAAMKCFKQHNK